MAFINTPAGPPTASLPAVRFRSLSILELPLLFSLIYSVHLMLILPLLGYLGLLLGLSFLTLSIASGLYYLSELVEEHTVLASRVLTRLVYSVIAIHLLLWAVDRFPFSLIALGIFSHLIYASNLRHFPIVHLTDPLFLLSCALVLINHWMWFRHFSDPQLYSGSSRGSSSSPYVRDRYTTLAQPTFTEIASYFGLCVWLVPFSLFVSLSAGENVLPSMGSEYATGERSGIGGVPQKEGKKSVGLAKAAVDAVRDWVGETGAVMGLWRAENVRHF